MIEVKVACPACAGQAGPRGGEVCGEYRGRGKVTKEIIAAEVLTPELIEVSSLYDAYVLGHRPSDGGLEDQPATFLDAMTILRRELARIEGEEIEKARERARQAAQRR